MTQYPTLHVENFAGIRQADIELAPLTLFVGDNNSGKTYLSTLIWGLDEAFRQFLTPNSKKELPPELQKLWNWSEMVIKGQQIEGRFEVTEELHSEIVEMMDEVLTKNLITWITRLFGSYHLSIGKISFSIPFQQNSFEWKRTTPLIGEKAGFQIDFNGHVGNRRSWGGQWWPTPEEYPPSPLGLIKSFVHSYLWWPIATENKSFFPDSRVGILLTYPSVIDDSVEARFGIKQQETLYQLTAPQKEFLKQIKRYGKERESFNFIVSLIESKMIRGKVVLKQEGLTEFLYHPDHLKDKKPLPMNLSSGVVTSLAPFLAALKYGSIGNRCFIEEPEMSLHPKLQWRMAQVLVRLANSIGMVLATTHSATIIQHVNNMIKLSNREDGQELAKEYGYEPEDIISSDKVRMYQFDVDGDGGKTEVSLLEHSINGFAVPTFGGYLRELKDQIWAFQNEID